MSLHVGRATRFVTSLPALYRRSGEAAWKRGLTRDISDSGVLFEAGEMLPPESIVELTFHLPEQLGNLPAGQFTCIGKVVRQPPITESLPPRAAARFLEWRQGDDTSFGN